MLFEVECHEVEDGKGSETSMNFAMKASISEMVSLKEGGKKTVGVKVFLVEDCREEVLMIKDEVGSVNGFGRKRSTGVTFGDLCTNMTWEGSKV